jgi:ATP-dependent Clp protease protease subunit
MSESKSLADKIYENRIIVINGEINSETAANVIFQLLNMEKEDSSKDIYLYINSPGGSVNDGLAIYDTMNYVKPDVATVCFGTAASMGSFLLSSGAKGKRSALPNSNILIHQPLIGLNGIQQQTDIEIIAKNLAKTRAKLESILAKNTNKTIEVIHKDSERDYYMSAEDALEYGLIDHILSPYKLF